LGYGVYSLILDPMLMMGAVEYWIFKCLWQISFLLKNWRNKNAKLLYFANLKLLKMVFLFGAAIRKEMITPQLIRDSCGHIWKGLVLPAIFEMKNIKELRIVI
jgi:hypothetical protein